MILTTICDRCGMTYDDLRTGLTFGDVRNMLWVAADDPSMWRQKRRHGVLGFWREIKQGMWREHLEMCKPMDDDVECDCGVNVRNEFGLCAVEQHEY